eukprot:4993585-Prorocentrum_lima.AAC.1
MPKVYAASTELRRPGHAASCDECARLRSPQCQRTRQRRGFRKSQQNGKNHRVANHIPDDLGKCK